MRFCLSVLILVLILTASGTGAGPRTLVIEGTGDSQVILRELAALFEVRHPDVRVSVPDSVGSGGGVKALITGKADLARTARPLKPKEKTIPLTQIPFAWSPVVFAAHPSGSPVKNVAMDQALGIYRGELVNWKALGGPDHKLYPVNREQGDSSRTVVDAYLIDKLGRPRGLGGTGKVYYTTGDTVWVLERNAFSFGYVPLSSAMAAGLHVFALDGVFPNESSVTERRYPLVTTFYLVSSPESGGLARDFLTFVKSEPARNKMRVIGVFSADKAF